MGLNDFLSRIMSENVVIRLAADRLNFDLAPTNNHAEIYTPGQIITHQPGFMRYVFSAILDKIEFVFQGSWDVYGKRGIESIRRGDCRTSQ